MPTQAPVAADAGACGSRDRRLWQPRQTPVAADTAPACILHALSSPAYAQALPRGRRAPQSQE
eukprot:9198829-Lingulodinium_polyedra.AAC.1